MVDQIDLKQFQNPKAQERVQKAQDDAQAALAQVDAEVEKIVSEAIAAGQEQGSQQAMLLGEKLKGLKTQMHTELSTQVVHVAFETAKQILEKELETYPQKVVDVIRNSLKAAAEAEQVWLRVNPQDMALVKEHKQDLINVLGRAKDVLIREDKAVLPGGVIIQTEAGVLDAQPKTQLAEIGRILGL